MDSITSHYLQLGLFHGHLDIQMYPLMIKIVFIIQMIGIIDGVQLNVMSIIIQFVPTMEQEMFCTLRQWLSLHQKIRR